MICVWTSANLDWVAHHSFHSFYFHTDKYVSRDGILDYLQAMCVEISKRYRRAPADWCPPAPAPRPVPSCASASGGYYNARFCTEVSFYLRLCVMLSGKFAVVV